MRLGTTLLSTAAILLGMGVVAAPEAGAQTIVMRKAITKIKPTSQQPSNPGQGGNPLDPKPVDPDAAYYSWVVSSWKQSAGACGSQGTETRDVACKRTDGTIVPDAGCVGNGSGPKPISSRPATITQSCAYGWKTGDWSPVPDACGPVIVTRDVTCTETDGTVVSASLCKQPRPASTMQQTSTASCTFAWESGVWSAPDKTCGDATQTRAVSCKRSDGTLAEESSCATVGDKPATTQHAQQTSGCGYRWSTGEWGASAPACGASSQTRTVTCMRQDGTASDASSCTDARPDTTRASTDYTTCIDGRTPDHPYNWTVGAFSAPSTTCGTATSTRTVQCLNDEGGQVAESMCAGVKPDAVMTSQQTSGCMYAWTAGEFGSLQPACGPTVATRTVACRRSDGVVASDSSCASATRPASTQSGTDYGTCTFGWATSDWSALDTTCGSAAQSRDVYCQRSDGTRADDGSCTGAKPTASQTSYQTSGCGYQWQTGSFAPVAPACGSTTQTRTVTCQRSDGQQVEDKQCAAQKPDTEKQTTDYGACTYIWNVGSYSAPSATCGTATQTRNVTCSRSDGAAVGDAQCSASVTKPATSQTTSQTSGCTYSWIAGDYGTAAPACGASVQSRTVSCQRSDGTAASDSSLCTEARPADTQPATSYVNCTYKWDVSLWDGKGGCGDTVTQTRSVTCQRSNGDGVTDSLCTTAKPAATQSITDYSACGYSWKSVQGAWSSTCSATATRTNTVTCVRQDNVTVSDSFCTASTKPSTNETQGIYTNCSYTPTYGGYSLCSSTSKTKSQTLTSCVRSDGTDATAANKTANYAYCKQQNTVSCTPAYVATYAAYTQCNPDTQGSTSGTQTSQIMSCKGEDGAVVANSLCGTAQTRSCTIKTFTPTYNTAYGTCTGGTQTSALTACKTTDTTNISGNTSLGLCPAEMQTISRSCTNYTCSTFKTHGLAQGSSVTIGIGVGTDAAAKVICENYANANQKSGACQRETYNQQYLYFVPGVMTAIYQSYLDQNVTFCTTP